jgi:hypothetical protein
MAPPASTERPPALTTAPPASTASPPLYTSVKPVPSTRSSGASPLVRYSSEKSLPLAPPAALPPPPKS